MTLYTNQTMKTGVLHKANTRFRIIPIFANMSKRLQHNLLIDLLSQ